MIGSRSLHNLPEGNIMMCCLELVSEQALPVPPLCQDGAGAILGHSLAWALLDGPGCCCKVSITRRPSSVFWGAGGASGWENYKTELCSPSCLSPCMSLCGANLYKSLSYFAITFKGSICHHLCTSLDRLLKCHMILTFFPLVLEFSLEMFWIFIRDVFYLWFY